jgi:hypothetical protein
MVSEYPERDMQSCFEAACGFPDNRRTADVVSRMRARVGRSQEEVFGLKLIFECRDSTLRPRNRRFGACLKRAAAAKQDNEQNRNQPFQASGKSGSQI